MQYRLQFKNVNEQNFKFSHLGYRLVLLRDYPASRLSRLGYGVHVNIFNQFPGEVSLNGRYLPQSSYLLNIELIQVKIAQT